MDVKLPDSIDRHSWAELMNMDAGDIPDDKAGRCEELLMKAAEPKGIFVYSDRFDYEGLAIRRHLEGCSRTVLCGITLGRRVDDLITRLQVTDMEMAVYADCGASALAEQAADLFEEYIRMQLPEETPYMTCRFAPGYGDLPLAEQRYLIKSLDAERKIGLTLNDSDLLVPLKSLTGILGIADHPVSGHHADCSCCMLAETCIRRKEGRICGR